jgi:hypothetical protein
MNHRKLLSSVFAAVLALAMAGAAQADYLVGLTHGTDKQRPEFSFTPVAAYHLYAAQNEWEPFQVLLRDTDTVQNVDVAVTEFTGPGEAIAAPELYRVWYVPVDALHISHIPPDMSLVGDWPDGLVPFVDHFFNEQRNGAPFDLKPAYTQAVFADVYVPAGQTPGDYTATVTVTADSRPTWTGTVTLTVWNFALPNGLSIDSNYGFGDICGWHQAHGFTGDCRALLDKYLLEFARHRMSLQGWSRADPVYTWDYNIGSFDWDWTAFDAANGPYFNGTFYTPGFKFTGYGLPGAPGGCPSDVDPSVWEREFWRGWAAHFRANGWLHQLYYYLPDEPKPPDFPAVCDLAHRLHVADPGLRPQVTKEYIKGLQDCEIDIWDPDEPRFSDCMPFPPYPDVYPQLQKEGKTVWWYNCVSATAFFDFANHFVDGVAAYQRIWGWLTRRYTRDGTLYWSTVYLFGDNEDPWVSEWSPPYAQGDGQLIYPGTIDHIGGEQNTDIPVASIRMKYIRESMEDYEYFHLLDQMGYSDWVDNLTQTVAPKTFQWEHDFATLLNWRKMAAEKILGTLDETPPDPPTNLAATGLVGSIALTWTKPTATDLAGYNIHYAIYQGDDFFGGKVGADATGATVDGLPAGREISLWVVAFDQNMNLSADSAVVTATPLAADDDDDDDDASPDAGNDGDSGGSSDDDEHNPNGVSVSALHGKPAASGCGCGGR